MPPYWNVSTFSNTYAGPINLVQATWQSDNTVYAQLALDVGPRHIVAVAHRMGITSPLQPYPSIVLGSEVVNPLEVADAYATFAAEGIHHAPQAIEKVVFPNGSVERSATPGHRAIPAGVAYVVDKILEGNTRYGTAAAMPTYYSGHRGRQDGHDHQLGRRLVLRLRPEARHRRVDGLSAGRGADARRAGRDLLRAHLGQVLRDGLRRAADRRLHAAGRDAGLPAVDRRLRGGEPTPTVSRARRPARGRRRPLGSRRPVPPTHGNRRRRRRRRST